MAGAIFHKIIDLHEPFIITKKGACPFLCRGNGVETDIFQLLWLTVKGSVPSPEIGKGHGKMLPLAACPGDISFFNIDYLPVFGHLIHAAILCQLFSWINMNGLSGRAFHIKFQHTGNILPKIIHCTAINRFHINAFVCTQHPYRGHFLFLCQAGKKFAFLRQSRRLPHISQNKVRFIPSGNTPSPVHSFRAEAVGVKDHILRRIPCFICIQHHSFFARLRDLHMGGKHQL